MSTNTENLNLEETLPNNNRAISPLLSSGIITNSNGIADTATISQVYAPNNNNTSLVAQNGLVFNGNSDLSNGLSSLLTAAASGITDFTAYNAYIHYDSLGGGGGFLSSSAPARKINIMNNIVLASQRFEIYSRQYRN